MSAYDMNQTSTEIDYSNIPQSTYIDVFYQAGHLYLCGNFYFKTTNSIILLKCHHYNTINLIQFYSETVICSSILP